MTRPAARAATATDVVLADLTNPEIWLRSLASGASTVCESSASFASWWFWEARILNTLSVSPKAGLARRITALRSDPRVARPVPSSSITTPSAWRTGICEMFWRMSVLIGELVRVTGRKCCPLPGPDRSVASGRWLLVPGLQFTYSSPISDCGRIVHVAFA